MRKLQKLIGLTFILLIGSISIIAQTSKKNLDTVMVMPFENTSGKAEFNWVGESIADSLADLLRLPRSLNVISNEERKIMQRRMKMRLTVLPSLATSIRIAREGGATLLVAGSYTIMPETEDVAASVTIKAKIIRVNEGRFLAETLPNGNTVFREINLNDALGNLQTVEGQLAYQILYQHDSKTLPVSLNELIESANKVPSRAFEAYIKGLFPGDNETRANYFKNALAIYAVDREGAVYSEAALELGHLYMNEKEAGEALEFFSKVPAENSHYAEAAFYMGLIQWQQKNYDQALAILRPLADDLKFTSVYNMLGAISVRSSVEADKDDPKKEELLKEGTGFLQKAAESASEENDILFNLGFALFLEGKYQEAADKFRKVVENDPEDGEAYFLLSKTQEKLGDESALDFDNQARRFLTEGNKYANLQSNWTTGDHSGINMRVDEPKRNDFVSVIIQKNRNDLTAYQPVNKTAELLKQANTEYEAGKDEAAAAILRRLIPSEPTNAESHLLFGKIHLRRGDLEQAADSLKTAYFFNNQLIEAHILLGRIFIQKEDCLQAKNYSRSALEIDPENEDALRLERQVERCSK